jgi:cytochrome c551/c552
MMMKKVYTLLLLLGGLLYATKGEAIFDAKCLSCHKKNQKEFTKDLVAPTLPMIITRLKSQLLDQEEFEEFVVSYIVEPSQEKALCASQAILMFGLMPPIGKQLTPQERQAVATWMYTKDTPQKP